MRMLERGLLALTAVAFVGTSTAAYAATATQGYDTSNYLRDSAGNWKEEVCDKEADGYGVHADFQWGSATNNQGGTRFDESGGSASACDRQAPGSIALWGLYRHRTVEERPDVNELDIKGEWDYH